MLKFFEKTKILLPIKMGTCWRLCWISCSRWGGPLWVGRCFRNWWVLLTFGDSCSQLRLTKMTNRNDRGTERQQLDRWAFQILNYYTSTDIRYIYIHTLTNSIWTEIDPIDIWISSLGSFPYAQGASAAASKRSRLMAGEVLDHFPSNSWQKQLGMIWGK